MEMCAGNALTGTIPAAPYASPAAAFETSFQTLDFSANQLTGSIPLGLTSQPIRVSAVSQAVSTVSVHRATISHKRAQEMVLSHNKLSGNLSFLTEIFSLNKFRADNNDLSGTIPPLLSNQLTVCLQSTIKIIMQLELYHCSISSLLRLPILARQHATMRSVCMRSSLCINELACEMAGAAREHLLHLNSLPKVKCTQSRCICRLAWENSNR